MENLNLREILKNTQKGTILYSTTHGNVYFNRVDYDNKLYPIQCQDMYGFRLQFTKEGKWHYNYEAMCSLN